MKIPRKIEGSIKNEFYKGKIIIIYGARQVGKTTVIQDMKIHDEKSIYLNCDEPDVRSLLQNKTSTELLAIIGNAKTVYIDEAQRVPEIGLTLKLLVDTAPSIQIIATGSSSFELANSVSEPLTGRNNTYTLFPFSSSELATKYSRIEIERLTEQRIIYGSYPEPFFLDQKAREKRLSELANDYVFKDIFSLSKIRKSEKIVLLLKALALQIGSEVSYSELGAMIGLNYDTVESYITALEQSFVIFRLQPYFVNARTSIKKSRKVYFWDTGIRNALINNWNPLSLRTDAGMLFENFFVAEILKEKRNVGETINAYFWRDYRGNEVDLVLENNSVLKSYECKLHDKETRKTIGRFDVAIVTKDNCMNTLLTI